jgi:hypothetical protein
MCGSGSSVEVRGLPWRGSLATSSETRLAFGEAGGAPEIVVQCHTILGNLVDECLGNTSTLAKAVSLGVELTSDSHSEKLTCSFDKSKNGGKLALSQLIESPAAGALTFGT